AIAVGLISGLFFNAHPQYSWETSTLIQIVICSAVMLGSALWPLKEPAYVMRTDAFFESLNRPIISAEKPILSLDMVKGMRKLAVFASTGTGLLFIGMSIPSLGDLSGQLSCGAGMVSLVSGVLVWPFKRKN